MMKNLFLASLLLPGLTSYAQESNISGSVTYFLNDKFGDRPDTGSKVYVVESSAFAYIVKKMPPGDNSKLSKGFKSTLDTLNLGAAYRAIYASYKTVESKSRPIPQDVVDSVKKYKADTDDKFTALDKRVYNIFSLLEPASQGDIQRGIVDTSGNFKVKVNKPGTYYVVIISNHRKGNNLSTSLGKIDCQELSVIGNDEKIISVNFRP